MGKPNSTHSTTTALIDALLLCLEFIGMVATVASIALICIGFAPDLKQ